MLEPNGPCRLRLDAAMMVLWFAHPLFLCYASLLPRFLPGLDSALIKIVGIDSLDLVRRDRSDSDTGEIDDELGERGTVDEDDSRIDPRRILFGVVRKVRGGDENPFLRSLTLKGTGEFLNLWPTNCGLPALRLDIDHIKAKAVFLYDAINAAITGTPHSPSGILAEPPYPMATRSSTTTRSKNAGEASLTLRSNSAARSSRTF